MTDKDILISDLNDISEILNNNGYGGWCKAILKAVALLKEQEAKWVEDKQDERCRLIKCSNCGLTFIVGNNIPYDEWIEDRNYCRRCGARMVKPND